MKKKQSGFGERLKVLRSDAGLTQKQLAEKVGLHEMSVYRLEAGSREPNWSTVLLLAKALGKPCTAFVEG